MIEFGIAARELAALRVRAILGKEVDPVALDAEVRAEAAAAVHHRFRLVVQVGRPGMLDLGRSVARPRKSVVIAVAWTALRA